MIDQQNIQRTLNTFRVLLALCVNLLILVLLFYGIASICMQGYHFCYEIFGSVVVEDAPGTERTFLLTESDTMWDVAERLKKEDLIVNHYSFYIRTRFMDPETVILHPGEYVLNTSMTYEEIINQLTTSE